MSGYLGLGFQDTYRAYLSSCVLTGADDYLPKTIYLPIKTVLLPFVWISDPTTPITPPCLDINHTLFPILTKNINKKIIIKEEEVKSKFQNFFKQDLLLYNIFTL